MGRDAVPVPRGNQGPGLSSASVIAAFASVSPPPRLGAPTAPAGVRAGRDPDPCLHRHDRRAMCRDGRQPCCRATAPVSGGRYGRLAEVQVPQMAEGWTEPKNRRRGRTRPGLAIWVLSARSYSPIVGDRYSRSSFLPR